VSPEAPCPEAEGVPARAVRPSPALRVPRIFEAEAGWALRGDREALARLVAALEDPDPGSAPGAALDLPELAILPIQLEPGTPTHWHWHDYPVYGYLASGRLAVEYEDGSGFVFEPGVFIAEVVGEAHRGRAAGDEAVCLVVFHRHHEGRPLSRDLPPPSGWLPGGDQQV
jgi:quercetin dioxygenase-like cupin family protein